MLSRVLRKVGIKKRRGGSKADLAAGHTPDGLSAAPRGGDHATTATTAEAAEGEEDEEGEEEVPADWKDQLTKMLLKDTNTMKHKRFYKVRRPSSAHACVCVCESAPRTQLKCACVWSVLLAVNPLIV
jgi:hypothetical protein